MGGGGLQARPARAGRRVERWRGRRHLGTRPRPKSAAATRTGAGSRSLRRGAPQKGSPMIDWDNPEAEAIDGFSVEEIVAMVRDGVARAVCGDCEAEHEVEPDAEG